MFSNLQLLSKSDATNRKALFIFIALVSSMLSACAVAQTNQTSLLPGNGAPLLVTPEVHLGSAPPAVGAANATAGSTAEATNATNPQSSTGATMQYSGPAYSVTITPNPATMMGTAPSTPEVHLGAPAPQLGAATASAGNAAGAVNATSTLPVVPRANVTLPEYTVRGSTIAILPPPEAIRNSPPSQSGETLPSTDRK